MNKQFSACEVIELGIQIEKNGKEFYEELAKQTDNEKAAAIFEFLASEEKKHIAAFKEIFDATCNYSPEEVYTEEYFAYMNSLASNHVFNERNKGSEIAKNVKTYEDGIDIAMRFEKGSILFFEEMKKMVPPNKQELIDELIQEEEKHLKKLCGMKEKK